MKLKKNVMTAALLLLTAANTMAQEQVLDEVTITSSLVEKRSSETGRNIVIIKGDNFLHFPVNSIDQLLRFVPGVEVQSRGPNGAQSDITLRGGTFQQVLVILDGLRLNDPNTGHFNGYIPITPAQIDRIEILKGASSAIYGADAVGGVVNIITKAFNPGNQVKKIQAAGQVGIGEYGLVNVNAGGFFKNDFIAVDAGVVSNHATGVQQRGARGFYHNTTASAGLHVFVDDYWSVSMRSVYDNRDFAAQNFYTTSLADTATERVTSWWHQARVAYQKNKSRLTLDAGFKQADDFYEFNGMTKKNYNHSEIYQALLQYQHLFTRDAHITVGANWQQKMIRSNDRGNHAINVGAPFVSYYHKLFNKLVLNPSLRAEFIGANKVEWVPQVNMSYNAGWAQFRASAGKSIRDADFTERFNNYNKAIVSSGQRVGNPALTAERSKSYEAGFDVYLSKKIKIAATGFQRFHEDLIDWTNTSYADMPRKDNLLKTGTYGLAKNIAEIKTSGVETDILFTHKFSDTHRFYMNGGFVWMYTDSDQATPSFYISSHARFMTNFLVMYECGRGSISISGIYKSRNKQAASAIDAHVSKDYFIFNAKAAVNILQKKLAAYVQVDNVLDRKYSDLLGATMPGRWLQGGLQFNLSK